MKATIEKGLLKIDMGEIVEQMDEPDKVQFYRILAFQEQLMIAVCDTVATGMAFNDDCEWWSMGGLADELREKLVPLMPDAVQEFVRSLIQERDQEKRWHRLYSSALNAICETHRIEHPEVGFQWVGYKEHDEVRQIIADAIKEAQAKQVTQ